jgi:hypothetical protein
MKTYLLACLTAILAVGTNARAEDSTPGLTGVEAVASRIAPDYKRLKLQDGSFQQELYAFGPGGQWGGEISDPTIDQLTFLKVAHMIAPSLASRNYMPGADPAQTKLLIMVYWGTTAVPTPLSSSIGIQQFQAAMNDPDMNSGLYWIKNAALSEMSMALTMLDITNRIRDQTDFKNAAMLGYDMEGTIGTEYGTYISHTALGWRAKDDVEEIEQNRYFVVLMAYDFQLLWKQKKHKLVWETRFSINEQHNQFDRALPLLANFASKYYGQPTNGLVRERLLNTDVEIGAPTLIQFLGNPKN